MKMKIIIGTGTATILKWSMDDSVGGIIFCVRISGGSIDVELTTRLSLKVLFVRPL